MAQIINTTRHFYEGLKSRHKQSRSRDQYKNKGEVQKSAKTRLIVRKLRLEKGAKKILRLLVYQRAGAIFHLTEMLLARRNLQKPWAQQLFCLKNNVILKVKTQEDHETVSLRVRNDSCRTD